MGAQSTVRCFYIANAYDGAYFVLTDSIEVYSKKMMAYMHNLLHSNKTNHYSFGTVEMTLGEYEAMSTDASNREKEHTSKPKEEKRSHLSVVRDQ